MTIGKTFAPDQCVAVRRRRAIDFFHTLDRSFRKIWLKFTWIALPWRESPDLSAERCVIFGQTRARRSPKKRIESRMRIPIPSPKGTSIDLSWWKSAFRIARAVVYDVRNCNERGRPTRKSHLDAGQDSGNSGLVRSSEADAQFVQLKSDLWTSDRSRARCWRSAPPDRQVSSLRRRGRKPGRDRRRRPGQC